MVFVVAFLTCHLGGDFGSAEINWACKSLMMLLHRAAVDAADAPLWFSWQVCPTKTYGSKVV